MRLSIQGYKLVETKSIGRPPLLSQQVVSLMVDDRGWIWVGQDAGLTVFDGHAWRSYTQDDGLIWNDTDENAVFSDTDGSMWIGTSGGITHVIQPEKLIQAAPLDLRIASATLGSWETFLNIRAPSHPL